MSSEQHLFSKSFDFLRAQNVNLQKDRKFKLATLKQQQAPFSHVVQSWKNNLKFDYLFFKNDEHDNSFIAIIFGTIFAVFLAKF